MRKVIRVLLFVVLLVFGLLPSSWAATRWEDPNAHQPPSSYAGREYTRQHYTEFRYDEGNGPQESLFDGWCSVFDLPPKYDQGYTAVGSKDEAWSKAYGWLPCLGVPNVDGYFIVSPNYWGTQGATPVSTGFVPSPMAPSPSNSEQQ